MTRHVLLALALAPMILLGAAAKAADSEVETLRAQLKSTVLQLRQLQDQMAATTPAPAAAAPAGGDAALKARLASTEAQLAAARRGAASNASTQAALAKAQAENTALTAAAAANTGEMEKFKAAYTQSEEANRALTLERDKLKAQLATASNLATACQAKNVKLVAFAEGLLTAYKRVSFGDALAAQEPFLQLKRVQLENIAQDREDAVRDATCEVSVVASPAAAGQ